MECVSIHDYEKLAKEKLPQMAYDYYYSGACDEITLFNNHNAYKKICLKYRVLVDVSHRNLSTEVLNFKLPVPIIIAPTAFHKMAHPEGEIATAKAANSENIIMTLSTLSNSDVEEVVKASSAPIWFQLYVYKDRSATAELIKRAELAGCKALVLTVDAPFLGIRERDVRNKFQLPTGLSVKNMQAAGLADLPQMNDSGISGYFANNLDPSLSWKDIEWLKSITKLPILLKGIACREDAVIATQYGVNGIIISNHGGRQLDTCRATIDVLPEVADAVQGKIEILIDGGIRRGTDILKAIALGAKAVLIGRPIIWGLAVDGENGVKSVIQILKKEFDLAMALCGCTSINDISKKLIV